MHHVGVGAAISEPKKRRESFEPTDTFINSEVRMLDVVNC